jgi:patatin-like phospholipase/acyl hydrolase
VPPKSGSLEGYNLLALDGGGVRGISSMIILKKIMDTVRDLENTRLVERGREEDPEERRPVDYFDLAAGTSTGGLIALMLFRLEMTCSNGISQYESMAKQVFAPRIGRIPLQNLGKFGVWCGNVVGQLKALTGHAQFCHKPLERVIDMVVEQYGLDDEDREKKGDAPLIKEGSGQM